MGSANSGIGQLTDHSAMHSSLLISVYLRVRIHLEFGVTHIDFSNSESQSF